MRKGQVSAYDKWNISVVIYGRIAIISFVVKFNHVNESSISKQKHIISYIFLVI
jgi:hypothetical protein